MFSRIGTNGRRRGDTTARTETNRSTAPKYDVVAMGGTFDVLHRGHRRLLKQAFALGRKVLIGVTSDDFARSLHKPHKIDPFVKRKGELEKLLSRWNVLSRARILPLNDRFGPTIT